MAYIPTAICSKCAVPISKSTGVYVTVYSKEKKVYCIVYADEFKCDKCNTTVILTIGKQPAYTKYDLRTKGFKKFWGAVPEVFKREVHLNH